MSKQKQHDLKRYTIYAYCNDCHRLLQQSKDFTDKELKAAWDQAVIGATSILCPVCKTKFPNFHIDLKIHDNWKNKNYTPKQFFPNPKNPFNPQEHLEEYKKQMEAKKAAAELDPSQMTHYPAHLKTPQGEQLPEEVNDTVNNSEEASHD